ncbi:MAG: DUF2845 domain-containing protein [Desulfobacterales bacterium]|nr:DUF2845 domain-containing protein [Desulfobacterales bacterium]
MKQKICILTIIMIATFNYCIASDFKCGKKLVSKGDTTFDILKKCKKPDWVDKTEIEVIKKTAPDEWTKSRINRETWLYNFGPKAFMMELIIENGKLVRIKSLRSGYREEDIGRFRNVETKLHNQMSKSEALIYWGDPDHKASRTEVKYHKANEEKILEYNVTVAEWLYNFGPNRFVKTLVFENNRMVEIKTGGYGYAE